MILKTEKEILRKLVIFKNSLGYGLFNPPKVWFESCWNSWLVLGVL